MRTLLGTFLATILLTGCGAGQQREISDSRSSGKAGQAELTGNHFHSSKGWNSTINLKVSTSANDAIVVAAINAIETWNNAAGREIVKYAGRKNASSLNSLYQSLGDTETILYAINDWQSATGKDKDVLGTTVWENAITDDEIIVRGDILLNIREYDYRDATVEPEQFDPNRYIVDAETVILHEMGHLLGLNHIDYDLDPDSVMHTHAAIGFGQFNRDLSAGDIALIQELYN